MDRRIASRIYDYSGPAPRTQSREELRQQKIKDSLVAKDNLAYILHAKQESERIAQSNARIALWPDWVRVVVYGSARHELTTEEGKSAVTVGMGEIQWSGLIVESLKDIAIQLEKKLPDDLNAADIARVLSREVSTRMKGKAFKKAKSQSGKVSAGATHLRSSHIIRSEYRHQPGNKVAV